MGMAIAATVIMISTTNRISSSENPREAFTPMFLPPVRQGGCRRRSHGKALEAERLSARLAVCITLCIARICNIDYDFVELGAGSAGTPAVRTPTAGAEAAEPVW